MLFFDINLEGLFFLESHTFFPYKSKLKGLVIKLRKLQIKKC